MRNSTKVPGTYLVILYKKLVLKTYIRAEYFVRDAAILFL